MSYSTDNPRKGKSFSFDYTDHPDYQDMRYLGRGNTLHRIERLRALKWLVDHGAYAVHCTLSDIKVYQHYVLACNILYPDRPDKAHLAITMLAYRLRRGGRFTPGKYSSPRCMLPDKVAKEVTDAGQLPDSVTLGRIEALLDSCAD